MQLSMWWLVLLQVFTTWWTGLGLRNENVIDIKLCENIQHSKIVPSACRSLKAKRTMQDTICYEACQLKSMHSNTKHDNRYKILPFGLAKGIRELNLNIKKRKHRHRPKLPHNQNGVDHQNIIRIKKDGYVKPTNTIMAVCNVQSLKAKHLQVSEALVDYSLDLLVTTETWLTDKDDQ